MRSAEAPRLATSEPVGRFEPDIGAQQLFAGALEAVRKDEIKELSDFAYAIDRSGKMTNGLDNALVPGLHLSQGMLMWCKETGSQLPDRIAFEPQNLLRIGRENSRRKVFFGSLAAQWFRDGGINETLQVAVKPAETGGCRTAMHELAMYQHLEQTGLPTFDVLGMFVDDIDRDDITRPSHYLLTRFQSSITTMDTIAWGELSEQAKWQQLEPVIDTLVMLHSQLLFHGDLEFKNVAFGDIKGDRTIIDAELMTNGGQLIHPSAHPASLVKLMSRDFTSICTSFSDFIFSKMPHSGRPKNDIEKFERQFKYLYLPYYERLVRQDNPYRRQLLYSWETMVNQKSQQASGDW